MDRSHTRRRRGAILIMVTLSLFVMFGMLGLVVDLGWAYFTKKSGSDGRRRRGAGGCEDGEEQRFKLF